jgi:pimeloyl-ACP methyl ester carboxylesterase
MLLKLGKSTATPSVYKKKANCHHPAPPSHESHVVNPQFKFHTLPQRSGEVANVFIHGYSAGHDMEDRCALRKCIPSSLHNCINIFAFWPSGHWSQFDTMTSGGVSALARFNVLAGTVAAVADRAVHFNTSRNRATEMGKTLLQQLERYLFQHHPYISRVNLIGHSLGGRVVVSALLDSMKKPTHGNLEIGDVLLMAAATKLSGDEAFAIGKHIKGKLYNARSSDDYVLLLNLGESSAGRQKVEHCEDVPMPGFGHTDYWPGLEKVLRASGFQGYKGGIPALNQPQPTIEKPDPVVTDHLLYDLLELTSGRIRDQVVKHVRSSTWASLDIDNSVYPLAKEFQLLGGQCLVNLARGRGLKYVQVLLMLAEHYDLVSELHDCAQVIEMEALLISKCFRSSFGEGHVLAARKDIVAQMDAMSQKGYFEQVDALAASLTMTSYFSTPEAPKPEYRKAAPAKASKELTLISASAMSTLADLTPIQRIKAAVTNLKSAVKPGYSALIPAVAIIFYARFKLDNEGLL